MRQMMLFDVKLVTWAIAGRVKDVLATMVRQIHTAKLSLETIN